jgi:hypothetical protein
MAGTIVTDTIQAAATSTLLIQTGSSTPTTAISIDTSQNVSVPANLLFNSGYGSAATAYGCRAWVNFDGTTNTGGFCTIRGSGNVTSVSDGGVGIYTVNITNAMPDVNYCVNASASTGSISSKIRIMTGYTTTAVTLRTSAGDTSAQADAADVFVTIIR